MSETKITEAARRYIPMAEKIIRENISTRKWHLAGLLTDTIATAMEEARAEALEEAAKAIERIAAPLRAEGKRQGAEGDLEGAALRIMQFDGANAALEAIRSLRSGEREGVKPKP